MVRRLPVVLRRGPLAAALAVVALAAAGCGGDDDPVASGTTATTGSTPTTTDAAPPRTTTDGAPPTTTDATPPSGPSAEARRLERRLFPDVPPLTEIPQEATGPADAGTRRVAERWFALVRAGRDAEAARLMKDGTRFANVDVLRLENGAARRAAAASLPCGAKPVSVGGAADGYVVLTLELTDKAGLPPCDGAGSPVAVALHVTDGRIDDWVRVQADDAPINRGTPV